jgi:hypothetical protein
MADSRRIVVQLADDSGRSGKLPDDVAAVLHEAGSGEARSPHPDVLPGLYVVPVATHVDVDRLIKRLSSLPSVRHAEMDQMRDAL